MGGCGAWAARGDGGEVLEARAADLAAEHARAGHLLRVHAAAKQAEAREAWGRGCRSKPPVHIPRRRMPRPGCPTTRIAAPPIRLGCGCGGIRLDGVLGLVLARACGDGVVQPFERDDVRLWPSRRHAVLVAIR